MESEGSKSRSKSQGSNCNSVLSSAQSVKRVEAAADAAASQEILAVMEEKERQASALQKLEVETKQCELENLIRQQAMEEQRRKLERLEEIKRLNAAKARVKIYNEAENNYESRSLPYSNKLMSECHAVPITPLALFQAPNATSFAFTPLANTEITSQALKALSPPFIPQATPVPTAVTQLQQNSDLVSILAEAISANHLPTPEPAMFTGDPLKFKDWQLSFETLIERKNIPKKERLYYLRKYLGGSAKKAVEGFLLVGTDEAYDSAWQLLEKRFGDPFTIGKCFRDKLQSWPKISSKDRCELREFADFLKSCEAAMPRIKTLEVLNDCMESQRILLKLPDWLVSRWNRKAKEMRQTNGDYPAFQTFVEFMSTEADLACDP